MARIIDLGLKKPDDPIFTEGIGIVSFRKPNPSVGPRSIASNQTEVPKIQTKNETQKKPEPKEKFL